MRWLYILLILVNYNVQAQPLTAENIFNLVNQSVVIVNAYNFYGFASSQGSGVCIGNGIIVTNYHVFSGNDSLEVEHYGKKYKVVAIVGADVEKDVLVLRLEDDSIPQLKYSDSISYNIGSRVYAIGSPYGYENSITEGIISGQRTSKANVNYIQISAGIDHGSSGGAVVNEKGELIGISALKSALASSIFINFAIPMDYIFSSLSICEEHDLVCQKSNNLFYKAYNDLIYYQSTKDTMILSKSLEYLNSYIQLNNVDSRITSYFSMVFQDRPYTQEFVEKYKILTKVFTKMESQLWDVIIKYVNGATNEIIPELITLINANHEKAICYYLVGKVYGKVNNTQAERHYYSKASELGDFQATMWLKNHGYIN